MSVLQLYKSWKDPHFSWIFFIELPNCGLWLHGRADIYWEEERKRWALVTILELHRGGRDQILATINSTRHPIFVQGQLSGLFIFHSFALNTHIINTLQRATLWKWMQIVGLLKESPLFRSSCNWVWHLLLSLKNGDLHLLSFLSEIVSVLHLFKWRTFHVPFAWAACQPGRAQSMQWRSWQWTSKCKSPQFDMAALQALVNALREELVTRTLLHFTVLLASSSSSFQASRSEDFVELVAAVRSTAQAARKVWQDWQEQVNHCWFD